MTQMGFFDLSDRYASLDAKKDPLVGIDAVVPWEDFRPLPEPVWRKPDSARKSNAGRKPMDAVLMRGNTASGVWADAACRSEEIETKLRAGGFASRIHRKGKRGKPLTGQAKKSNRTKSTVRVKDEHVFGAQTNDMGGTLVRTIGLARGPRPRSG